MFGSSWRMISRIDPKAASGRLAVRTYITADVAKSFSMNAKKTCRGMSSRTPVYFASFTTPTISIGEVPAGYQRNAHGLEIGGADRVAVRVHVLAGSGLIALDGHRAVPLVAF